MVFLKSIPRFFRGQCVNIMIQTTFWYAFDCNYISLTQQQRQPLRRTSCYGRSHKYMHLQVSLSKLSVSRIIAVIEMMGRFLLERCNFLMCTHLDCQCSSKRQSVQILFAWTCVRSGCLPALSIADVQLLPLPLSQFGMYVITLSKYYWWHIPSWCVWLLLVCLCLGPFFLNQALMCSADLFFKCITSNTGICCRGKFRYDHGSYVFYRTSKC